MLDSTEKRARPLPKLRWWIGGLLFASTVINYIDRQTLSVLAPNLKVEYHWSNEDFALIVIGFRLAYAFGQTGAGRVLDRIGTRLGLTITVTWYSTIAMLTSLASGLRSFFAFRFLLGLGESANWPGATKAVAEWFPKGERGWAVALFDSGSAIGGATALFLVPWLYRSFGGWRPAFIITGTLGFLWLIAWRLLYYPPETHPRISAEEREMILRDKQEDVHEKEQPGRPPSWRELLRLRQTWGVIIGRSFTDPVWFFITDWFAIYLVARGIRLEEGLIAFWIPFLAADFGNFSGGGFSSWLIRRGWPVGRARKAVIVFGGTGMLTLAGAAFADTPYALAALFGFSTFAYATFSTMVLVLPSDLYPSRSVATVSGMAGTGAGIGTILSTYLIGYVSDRYSFDPILMTASVIPFAAMFVVLVLLKNTSAVDKGLVRRI
ncbi:MAG: MFS transporter [Acidobacteria bacterium]|nr:MAG: MFS transporter [Acidobacteriota bacterium]